VSLIVQKFGGSSVADVHKIRLCAQRAKQAHEDGRRVVVVVSAMGKTTDGLIALARDANETLPKRDLDMLLSTGEQVSAALMSMTLKSLGLSAIAFTGQQVGVSTTDSHTRARIASIDAAHLKTHLDEGKVVVVTGFQGVTRTGDITTLGRGGSDLTAVALAAALKADVCEIFTDVDGVYTTDTRIVPEARKLDRISYEQMLELASLGAKVMHPRAVLCGKNFNVPIHVRHSHRPDQGTMIVSETPEMEQIVVSGAALKSDIGRVTLAGVPNTPQTAQVIFDAVADADIFVDDIIQNETGDGLVTISFTVEHNELADAGPCAERIVESLGKGDVHIDVGLAKVSVVGVGMRSHTGVAATMFRALGAANVNIRNITTSEIKISCIIDKADGEKALRTVHDAFDLSNIAVAAAAD
jgi:aspartate kinase